jgi:hypothetical protein
MTERVLGPTGSRSRTTRASLLLMALMGLVFGVLIGGGSFASAAKPGAAVVNYQQCADGKFVEGQDESNACPKDWINSILNEQNSSYHEDQVTPQRLIIDFPSGASHTIDLSWLVRKGDAHAYDSLATWNHTQDGADPCQGLTGPTGTACTDAVVNGTMFPKAIPDDGFVVTSPCNDGSAITSEHQLDGQQLEMYGLGTGGGVDSMVYTGSESDSEGLFRSATITFHFGSASGGRAYLYFGGHLARGEGSSGWGDDCGAGSISGGPYHIKENKIDGDAAGARDNQIMSGAILPLADALITSDPAGTPTTTWSASLTDSATVTGDNPTGDVIFRLYAPGDTTCTTAIFTNQKTLISGSVTSDAFTNIGSAGTYGAGTYQWTVEYLGDPGNNAAGPTACGETSEQITVTAATNATVT